MRKILLSTLVMISTTIVSAQNVNIPDGNLKAALVGDNLINTNNDSEIQVSEAQAYNGDLILGNLNITNVTGLTAFTQVETINLQENNISNFSYTGVSNTSVTTLILLMNPLNSLDLSGMNSLEWLDIGYCGLNTFNPSTVPSLETFFAPNNDFTSLDFTGNISMKNIIIGSNTSLSSINLSTSLPDLWGIQVNYCNNLSIDLDLSNQPALTQVYADNSPLTGLNVANGNNTNFSVFKTNSTPNLTCIEVDDVAYSTSNWTNIDANDDFSLDCDALPPADTIYVNINATGNNDGTSWNDAYVDARDAFINANARDQVWIAQGTYIRNSTDRNTVFGWTVDSLKVYGGFSGNGTETSITERDWNLYPTIFSGDIGVVGDSTDNAYTVFAGPIGALNGGPRITYSYVDGIKVTGGNASENSYPDYNTVGGGIVVDAYTDHTVWNNIEIYDCYAEQGAAISFWNYQLSQQGILEMNNFNVHDNSGPTSIGFHVRSRQNSSVLLKITNSIFYNNQTTAATAASGQDYGSIGFLGTSNSPITAEVSNCTFYNNTVNTINNNKGVLRTHQSISAGTLNLNNCIFYGNDLLDLTYRNWDNQGGSPFANVNMNNNILENGHDYFSITENNTSTADPLFTDAANNDFTLQSTSPAIDAGTQTGITPYALDLAGNPRIYGSEIDLGAYEYQGSGGNNGVGIEEVNSTALILYPNPTTGIVNIKMNEAIKNVTVYNQMGKAVANYTTNSFSIDQFPAGIYYVKIVNSQTQVTQKIVKK